MIAYRPAAYTAPQLAQTIVTPADSTVGGAPVPQGLLWTALAGAASYAAIRTGMREKGFKSIVGWTGGVAAGLAALIGLAGIVSPNTGRLLPIRWYA